MLFHVLSARLSHRCGCTGRFRGAELPLLRMSFIYSATCKQQVETVNYDSKIVNRVVVVAVVVAVVVVATAVGVVVVVVVVVAAVVVVVAAVLS